MQFRHCGLGIGTRAVGAKAHQHLAQPLPKPEQTPVCPPPSPTWASVSSALALFGKEAGRTPRLCRLGSRRGWGAAEASPRICGKPGSGKVFQKFPAAPAQVASAGLADSGKHASLAAAASAATAASSALWAARSLAGSGPGSRRAGPPPGAKAAADAGGSEGGSCPAPTAQAASRRLHLEPRRAGTGPRRSRGLLARYREPLVPEQRTLASSSPHPTPLPSWPTATEGRGPP